MLEFLGLCVLLLLLTAVVLRRVPVTSMGAARALGLLAGAASVGLLFSLGHLMVPSKAEATYEQQIRSALGVKGRLYARGGLNIDGTATTCADDDAGSAHTACTVGPPYPAYVRYTCTDANGCDLTLSETSAVEGDVLIIENAGSNVINFADTANVTLLKDNFAAQLNDVLMLIYNGASWTELNRTVNSSAVAVTCVDNDAGTAGACTLGPPYPATILYTCSDLNGCTVTLSETSAKSGDSFRVVNVSSNTATFADTSGVSETAGSFAAGQWDAITYVYITDRWVELARSNN